MTLLEECSEPWGSAEVSDDDPAVTVIRNAFYLPYVPGGRWGLLDADGCFVRTAADYREGIHLPPDQLDDGFESTTVPRIDQTVAAPHGAYVYGGRINPHFGHFLINTLPRFWNIARLRSPCTPILCHGPGCPANWFAVPFIAAAFDLLGLAPRDFVAFDRPTRCASIVVPGTSLEEQKAGYRAYRRLCCAIGERARHSQAVERNIQPLYFSKARMASAVGVIVNEDEIEPILRKAGIKVVYPETLSLAEQIALMSSHDRLLGTAGSFLHTSIFCPPRTITCLNVTRQINSNFLIIDRLSGNCSRYLYPPALQVLEQRKEFLTARYLPRATDVAEELLLHARY